MTLSKNSRFPQQSSIVKIFPRNHSRSSLKTGSPTPLHLFVLKRTELDQIERSGEHGAETMAHTRATGSKATTHSSSYLGPGAAAHRLSHAHCTYAREGPNITKGRERARRVAEKQEINPRDHPPGPAASARRRRRRRSQGGPPRLHESTLAGAPRNRHKSGARRPSARGEILCALRNLRFRMLESFVMLGSVAKECELQVPLVTVAVVWMVAWEIECLGDQSGFPLDRNA